MITKKHDLSYPDDSPRIREFFAWTPVTIRNGAHLETRWLCKVRIREEYISMCGWEPREFL